MKFTAVKKTLLTGATALFLSVSLFSGVAGASVNGLNGIGENPTPSAPTQSTTQSTTTTTIPDETPSSVDAVTGLWDGLGVDQEASNKANVYMSPIAKGANVVFAIILAIASIGMFVITALDMLYIAVPPVRNFLHAGGAGQQAQGGMGGGMGMGGMGMGMGGMRGGMGMGGMGGGQQSAPTGLAQWISDEAVAAYAEGQGGGQQAGGGMGMGGMGMMGAAPAAPAPAKSIILSYLKKRALFLAAFGICAILLSTTIFTDLGVIVGSWILTKLTGL